MYCTQRHPNFTYFAEKDISYTFLSSKYPFACQNHTASIFILQFSLHGWDFFLSTYLQPLRVLDITFPIFRVGNI